MSTWEETKSKMAAARDNGTVEKVNVVGNDGRVIYNKLYRYPTNISNMLDWGNVYGFVDPYEIKRNGWEISDGWR